jgi:hypothetical protein
MMDCDSALQYKLASTTAVSNLVGAHIHPLKLPETASLPAITYQLISSANDPTHDEAPGHAYMTDRYQTGSWATTYKESVALARAVFFALHGFSGSIYNGADYFIFGSCFRAGKHDEYDPETGLYCRVQDFLVQHIE